MVGLIKKISSYKMSYFPESYSHHKNKIKVVLELSSYATKFDFNETTGIDTSKFAKNMI